MFTPDSNMQISNRPLPNGTMWWCERGWKIVRNNYFPTLLDSKNFRKFINKSIMIIAKKMFLGYNALYENNRSSISRKAW